MPKLIALQVIGADVPGIHFACFLCLVPAPLGLTRSVQPAYPVPTLLVLTASLAFLVGAVINDRTNSVYALLLLVASYPVRLLLRVRR